MSDWWSELALLINNERTFSLIRAALLGLGGLIVARLVSRAFERLLREYVDAHQTLVLRRLAYFLLLGLFVAAALHQLGFQLAVLFGAAGILSVALGFASQTSASNLVSGLFLLSERPFAVGDVIRIGGPNGTVGEVLSVDLLSAKLRTFDNIYVRIPNESLIKSEVATLTRFPIRRIDLEIPVAYREDVETVRHALIEMADSNPLCLKEPAPLFIFRRFADSALDLQFSVWVQKENFLTVKTELYETLHREFRSRQIEIPFPQRTVHFDECSGKGRVGTEHPADPRAPG